MGLFDSKEWHEVATVGEFEETDRKLVDLGGEKQIGLFKVDGQFHAVSAWCSHQRMSLISGDLAGCELTCPFHGARFDIRNGQQLSLPATKPIPTFKVKIEGEKILVKA
ncbi:MAG: non-heme iron oxygenase ferredoxin subunit [Verrucomicrobia bacterium]|nr:non-heme iron oxygenase ferredoxin subunit [Verrucomicrobiota bacterium]